MTLPFRPGDWTTLTRRFLPEDFDAFSRLSGDRNPLHHDLDAAAATTFGRPIVPVHLTAAPLSALAGMRFPGDTSLYLGHELKALAPVYYGDELTYSAKVVAVSEAQRVLDLSVLALRGTEVVLEARLRVKARPGPVEPHPDIRPGRGARVALVTGAGGGIGGAVARRLAKAGWRLILQGRRSEGLAPLLADLPGAVPVIADLESAEGRAEAARAAAEHAPALVVHAASPALDAAPERLLSVNHRAFKALVDAALPHWLAAQDGGAVLIGSAALESMPPGWDDYVAAKAAAQTVVSWLNRQFGRHGIRALTVAPGFVATKFSAAVRDADTAVLLPEEVAETVEGALDDGSGDYLALDPFGLRQGYWGFHARTVATPAAVSAVASGAAALSGVVSAALEAGSSDALDDIVRRFFGLGAAVDLEQAGLGLTPGWDSLRHIELLLTLERDHHLTLSAEDLAGTRTFKDLLRLWRSNRQGQGPKRS